MGHLAAAAMNWISDMSLNSSTEALNDQGLWGGIYSI